MHYAKMFSEFRFSINKFYIVIYKYNCVSYVCTHTYMILFYYTISFHFHVLHFNL